MHLWQQDFLSLVSIRHEVEEWEKLEIFLKRFCLVIQYFITQFMR